MAKKDKPRGQALEPCPECGGTECGTPRIPVCCEACGHRETGAARDTCPGPLSQLRASGDPPGVHRASRETGRMA